MDKNNFFPFLFIVVLSTNLLMFWSLGVWWGGRCVLLFIFLVSGNKLFVLDFNFYFYLSQLSCLKLNIYSITWWTSFVFWIHLIQKSPISCEQHKVSKSHKLRALMIWKTDCYQHLLIQVTALIFYTAYSKKAKISLSFRSEATIFFCLVWEYLWAGHIS